MEDAPPPPMHERGGAGAQGAVLCSRALNDHSANVNYIDMVYFQIYFL